MPWQPAAPERSPAQFQGLHTVQVQSVYVHHHVDGHTLDVLSDAPKRLQQQQQQQQPSSTMTQHKPVISRQPATKPTGSTHQTAAAACTPQLLLSIAAMLPSPAP